VSARFFLNLSQTEGPAVAISVRTFVDRYDELAAGADKFGAEVGNAHELLKRRGVTATAVGEAKALLTQLTHVGESAGLIGDQEQEAALDAAESAMWAWYLEWSKIARIAIKERALLRQLGFLAARRGGGEEDETEASAAQVSPEGLSSQE
jgi:hypothetical protein